ncbi:MAG TPA: endopeptidase La, partial [Firmicutes bacterium]|nr:endopeptidase La [Bacillota bacterium]
VLFITTANNLYAIPRPLQDRMEIISIPGYTEEDKLHIAHKFLVPKQIRENGLGDEQVQMDEDVVREIIRSYTRESGVRSLERQIGAVCRKLAREVVAGASGPFAVKRPDLHKHLGIAQFRYDVIEQDDKVGVATGVAWTEMGGDTLFIEVSAMRGSGKLILTGKLGEVMRESAQAGYTYVRSRARDLGIPDDFYEKMDVHIHVPEGAIPKDGPSAGITIATALASALSGISIRHDVAMTGEITLRGRVLPVGGLKEKVLA